MKHRNTKHPLLAIVWPAFLAAGVLEALVFAVVDPHDLHWFGGAALGWSAQSIYSVSFLIFWAAISTSAVSPVTAQILSTACVMSSSRCASTRVLRG